VKVWIYVMARECVAVGCWELPRQESRDVVDVETRSNSASVRPSAAGTHKSRQEALLVCKGTHSFVSLF
jgi:hypothetical protein